MIRFGSTSIGLTTETERRIKILDYLRENSLDEKAKKINKSDVMRHLEGISRLNTTHKTIMDLIEEGKIYPIKDNPRSQTHYLTINENNEFNKIYNTLSEIEHMMNIVDVPFRKFPRLPLDGSKLDLDIANGYHPLIEPLQGIYLEVIPIIFQELLTRSNNNIDLEKDKQILNSRILQLQQKFIVYVGKEAMTSKKFDMFMTRLENIDPKALSLARVKEINPNLLNELKSIVQEFMRVLKNFKSRFPT